MKTILCQTVNNFDEVDKFFNNNSPNNSKEREI